MDGFSREYHTHDLVWFEQHGDVMEAIKREKQIKKWNRDWKVNLIQSKNPGWKDLYAEIL